MKPIAGSSVCDAVYRGVCVCRVCVCVRLFAVGISVYEADCRGGVSVCRSSVNVGVRVSQG